MLRFQCDENVPNAIAEKLREAGIDALTAHEARLRRTPDEDILTQSAMSLRVVVTHDRDYLRMHRLGRNMPTSHIASKADDRSEK